MEVAMPAPLAVVLMTIIRSTPDRLVDILLGLPIILSVAYLFAIIPSVCYAIIMEIWFHFTRHCTYSVLVTAATIGLSTVLLSGVGYIVQVLAFRELTISYLVPIGALDGMLLGILLCYISRVEAGQGAAAGND